MSPILTPVVALVAWTFIMWTWMYATRLPAMRRLGMKSDPQARRGAQMAELPAEVRWKADNYNNLMEQPTVFYAVALVLAVIGAGGGWSHVFAWAYVGLRVAHSLLQATTNFVEGRFVLFVLGSLALAGLTVQAVRAVF